MTEMGRYLFLGQRCGKGSSCGVHSVDTQKHRFVPFARMIDVACLLSSTHGRSQEAEIALPRTSTVCLRKLKMRRHKLPLSAPSMDGLRKLNLLCHKLRSRPASLSLSLSLLRLCPLNLSPSLDPEVSLPLSASPSRTTR